MALRRIALRDFVIVQALELDFSAGFTALTGETGAGKSILIEALQLALGARADAGVERGRGQLAQVHDGHGRNVHSGWSMTAANQKALCSTSTMGRK